MLEWEPIIHNKMNQVYLLEKLVCVISAALASDVDSSCQGEIEGDDGTPSLSGDPLLTLGRLLTIPSLMVSSPSSVGRNSPSSLTAASFIK